MASGGSGVRRMPSTLESPTSTSKGWDTDTGWPGVISPCVANEYFPGYNPQISNDPSARKLVVKLAPLAQLIHIPNKPGPRGLEILPLTRTIGPAGSWISIPL